MCLTVSTYVKKNDIKYIYKVFILRNNSLYSYYEDTEYYPGDNFPEYGEIETSGDYIKCPKFLGFGPKDLRNNCVISKYALHVFYSKNVLCRIITSANFHSTSMVILRLPFNKKDLIACGTSKDLALNRIHIPHKLYKRVVSGKKANYYINNVGIYF